MDYFEFKNNVLSFFGQRDNISASSTSEPGNERELAEGRITDPDGGWEPAGLTRDGDVVIQSLLTGRFVTLGPQDLTERKLVLLLGHKYCERYTAIHPKTKLRQFDVERLAREIVTCCQDMGPFDFDRVRGPGLYLDGDALVLNDGRRVTASDGRRIVPAPDYSGPCYEAGSSFDVDDDTEPATDGDVGNLLLALNSFGFRSERDQVTFIGWLCSVPFGKALPMQVIAVLTAEPGSGKSTLLELAQNMLGQQAVSRDGVPTKAQVLHAVGRSVLTMMVDEVEASTANPATFRAFCEALRSGTLPSTARRASRVLGGHEKVFNPPTGGLVAGINPPPLDRATASRTVSIGLNSLPTQSRQQAHSLLDHGRAIEARRHGARLRKRLFINWEVMRETRATAVAMLTALGHDSRAAQKFANIIAGYVTLTESEKATPQHIENLIEVLDIQEPEVADVCKDGDACLNKLLRKKVAVFVADGLERRKQHATVFDILKEVIHGPQEESRHLIRQLEVFGLRPLWSTSRGVAKAAWKLAVCGSNEHEGVRRLMMQTDWAHGGWKDVLACLPGAESGVQRVGGRVERVVVVPMPSELLEVPAPEVYDLPTGGSGQNTARGVAME